MQIVMEMGANPVHNACISNKKPLLRLLKVDEFFITVIKEVEERLTILFFICQINTIMMERGENSVVCSANI